MKTASTEKRRLTLDLDPGTYARLAQEAVDNKIACVDDPATMAEICRVAIVAYLDASPRQRRRVARSVRDGE